MPSHGKPIILLSDRQTTGGYAKIATVANVDIPKLAQRRTGDRVRFTPISVQQAQQLLLEEEAEMQEYRNRIHRPCREVLEVRLTAKRLESLMGE